MWPESLGLDVPRESIEKLDTYHALLLKWQKAINLISPKTIDDAWVRHFADSAQLSGYIPEGAKTIMDWGSGAGFPAMVLAMLRPSLDVHAVESDERKCQFMRTVSRETSVPIRIHTQRIEALELDSVNPDIITARALASVSVLLDYVRPWVARNPDLTMVLLKGENARQEVEDAQKSFDFQAEFYPSITEPQANIVALSAIKSR